MPGTTTVRVWGPLVRVTHWLLVVLFAVAYLTGGQETSLHAYAGYAIIGLIVFRVLLGLLGSEYAGFRDFAFGPAAVVKYLRSVFRRNPDRYIGHNPAGAYMAVLLLITLLAITFTGMSLYGLQGRGPFAYRAGPTVSSVAVVGEDDPEIGRSREDKSARRTWKEAHEVASNLTLALIGIHVLGVVVSSRLHRENLLLAMITGKKEVV